MGRCRNLIPVLSIEGDRDITDARRGCKALFYIEFVPVTEAARHLASGDEERERIRTGIDRLRAERSPLQ